MDDIIVLAVGRQFIEMATNMERMHQVLKQQEAARQQAQSTPVEPPKED